MYDINEIVFNVNSSESINIKQKLLLYRTKFYGFM